MTLGRQQHQGSPRPVGLNWTGGRRLQGRLRQPEGGSLVGHHLAQRLGYLRDALKWEWELPRDRARPLLGQPRRRPDVVAPENKRASQNIFRGISARERQRRKTPGLRSQRDTSGVNAILTASTLALFVAVGLGCGSRAKSPLGEARLEGQPGAWRAAFDQAAPLSGGKRGERV